MLGIYNIINRMSNEKKRSSLLPRNQHAPVESLSSPGLASCVRRHGSECNVTENGTDSPKSSQICGEMERDVV